MLQRSSDADRAYRLRWWTLLVLCLSLMVIGIDNTILNVALPTLAKPEAIGGLAATASQLQWVVDAYTIVFAGLLLTAGSLGDRFGRYRGLAIGLLVFGTGSALSAFAPSAGALIASRSLMGVGGAFIMPSTLSLITNVFTDPIERAKAIGIWAGVSALGLGLGPLVGGTLLAHFWWGSVFLVNIPVVAAALVGGYVLIPESRDPSAPRLDPVGAGLSVIGLVAVLWAVIEGPSHGWTSSEVVAAFVAGAVVLALFLVWELRSRSPMLNIHFFENRRFSAASGAITITFLGLFGSIFLLTQYLQTVLGFSTVKAGATLIPQSLVLMALAPMSPRWVHKFGSKVVVVGGMLVVVLAFLGMTTFQPDSSVVHVILVTMVLAAGMAHIVAPATESIMGSLPREKAGVGSAMNDTTRQVGGAVGVALLGSVLSTRYATGMDTLRGIVPAGVLNRARDSVGTAVGLARNDPAARPFAGRLVAEAHVAFVDAMHASVLVAAGILLVAAAAVAATLPARARAEAPSGLIPAGVGPVDVFAATPAGDVALVVEAEQS
jgi:EmrB/QacA subfamily drug resistance transporter